MLGCYRMVIASPSSPYNFLCNFATRSKIVQPLLLSVLTIINGVARTIQANKLMSRRRCLQSWIWIFGKFLNCHSVDIKLRASSLIQLNKYINRSWANVYYSLKAMCRTSSMGGNSSFANVVITSEGCE